MKTAPEPYGPRASRGRVLRTFVHDGKVIQLPAKWAKRRIVLEHVVTSFEPGVRYPERAVNEILRTWHPDYCALRRYLVDEDLMAREASVYWRTGGPAPPFPFVASATSAVARQ
jgi:hypothetical protein